MTTRNKYVAFEKFKFIDDMIEDGNYEVAGKHIRKELKNLKNKEIKLYLGIIQCKIIRLSGQFKVSVKKLKRIKNKVLAAKNLFLHTFFLTEIGWSYRLSGDLIQSSNCINLAEVNIKDIEKSSEYLELKIMEFKAIILHNRAVILLAQENITLALFTAYESLRYREKIGHKHGKADALNIIGLMHWYNGELDLASEQFANCYLLRKEVGNPMLTALVLLNLVQLNVQRGSNYLEIALNYYKEFEEFKESDTTNNIQVINYFQFVKAVYLKNSKRFKYRVEAEKLFYDLIENDEIDSQHILFAYYYLADLLFYELSTTGDQEILHELRTLVDGLSQMGDEKKMNVAISRSHLLRAKLKIIDGDIDGAKNSMTIALNLALEANDNILLHAITYEYDKLFKKEDDVLQINEETPFHERIEIAEIEQLVSQLNQRGMSESDESDEKSILFLIMFDVGTLVFSKTFEETTELNENLVSNFIGAINNFGNEVFSSSGFIDRINHKAYTILMKSVGAFVFSYVFKGSSYAPSKKLNEISNMIMNMDFIDALDTERRITTINRSVKSQMNSIVESVILNIEK